MFLNNTRGYRFGQAAVKRTPDQIKSDIAAANAKLQQLQAQKQQKLQDHAVLTKKLQAVQTKIAQIQGKK